MDNLNTSFGNKKVTKSQKTILVQKVFNKVAKKYDLMNDLMSFGTHRLWKKRLVELINIQNNQKILDIGSGTGDVGIKIAKQKKSVEIFLGDLNLSMLQIGKKKNNNEKNVYWINMNAENLPFKNNYFDKCIMSFCLRNITDMDKALNESIRVLKSGGEFFCLEFSKINMPIIKYIYEKYKNKIIPLLGKYINNKEEAYKYLAESIGTFPNQDILCKKLIDIGYVNVSYYNLFNGIVAIHKAWKI